MSGNRIEDQARTEELTEIIRQFIRYARSRGYNLQASDFLQYGEEVLRREYEDFLRQGVNSWVTSVVGETVVRSRVNRERGR